MPSPNFIRETLDDLKRRDLYRALSAIGSPPGPRVRIAGREVLQFASNNYLGLANDPRVKEAAKRGIEKWGWGTGASRLVAGHTEAHEALEADLAAFMGSEAALVFPTGYQANLGLITTLAGRGDPSTGSGQATVIGDRSNHASIYDAVRLSGARLLRYRQADAADAARVLEKLRAATDRCATSGAEHRRLIASDTVFSMDGDLAPLDDLAALARRTGSMLLLDEAHAVGVLGPTGAGVAEELGLRGKVTARVATLSKALGGIGGFVAASRNLCDLIVNRARPFIYTTALPAAACEAARTALEIVRTEPERRNRLADMALRLKATLRSRGFQTNLAPTPIAAIILGGPEAALDMAAKLLERGIFCPAIRPPTVPPGTSRLRVSLTAEHTDADVARLVEALSALR
jgi:8-amino-7-oxononanoate synthase